MESALYNRDILRLAASLVAGDRLETPTAAQNRARRSAAAGFRLTSLWLPMAQLLR